MVTTVDPTALPPGESQGTPVNVTTDKMVQLRGWRRLFGSPNTLPGPLGSATSSNEYEEVKMKPEKWSLGVLNDKETDEVPGSILLMSSSNRNEPLGLRNAPARTSASSLPSPYPPSSLQESRLAAEEKKRTSNGNIILEPQPDDSLNDPLNWPSWRRDVALMSLGLYCMVGGGMTPVLAAGFTNVAATYHTSLPRVALTTGFYMMGLGLGSVIASPTAILFGKRPVYLVGIVLFMISSVWCALSPNYASLVVARVFMGFAVSPVECLPSATVAEIFFLHERAYRLGVYTLLLLGGKNLVPLVSAAIIQSLDWRWVFWIVTMVVGFCFGLVFFFVPETFWDRTPRPSMKKGKTTFTSISTIFNHPHNGKKSNISLGGAGPSDIRKFAIGNSAAAESGPRTIAERRHEKNSQHVGFIDNPVSVDGQVESGEKGDAVFHNAVDAFGNPSAMQSPKINREQTPAINVISPASDKVQTQEDAPTLHNFNSPHYLGKEQEDTYNIKNEPEEPKSAMTQPDSAMSDPFTGLSDVPMTPGAHRYTNYLRTQPAKTFAQTLKPWNGRLRNDNWFRVAFRPFILFAYPSILWSTLVYSLSIGWLIVLSESVAYIYRNKQTYNFSALGTGLVYISPFIGGILGTAVAGKVSDIIVRFMSRRNGGVYEPEFRLVMAFPVAIATCVGLMGFGWSAQERDNWIVPTVFFGIISFGCALGSTTAITFAVDSYRQYAGEALVTLNFSKNIFHGLVFSLFFTSWLEADGAKDVFNTIGGIQLACMLTTPAMYVYGKRARMWTVRRNFMERF